MNAVVAYGKGVCLITGVNNKKKKRLFFFEWNGLDGSRSLFFFLNTKWLCVCLNTEFSFFSLFGVAAYALLLVGSFACLSFPVATLTLFLSLLLLW